MTLVERIHMTGIRRLGGKGTVQELVARRSPRLHRAEKALLRLLRRKA